VTRETSDPFAGYDSQKAREALKVSAGALNGVDVEALIAEMDAAREQDTLGRPA